MFHVTGAEYDSFMGRFSNGLAPLFADFAGVQTGQRVLDVGCGPGALTELLSRRAGGVAAIDPAEQFVDTCRGRVPGADVRLGSAESLPWRDGEFDAALAQLVLTFMADADRAVSEMARVTRPGGVVAACMWASDEGMQLLHSIRAAAEKLGKPMHKVAYQTREEVSALFERSPLENIEISALRPTAAYADFEDYWTSVLGAPGNVGKYLGTLSDAERGRLGDECFAVVGKPSGAFELGGKAWAARGTAPARSGGRA